MFEEIPYVNVGFSRSFASLALPPCTFSGMAESMPVSVQPLGQRMDVLAALEPSPFPFISLYLDLTPNQNGREDHRPFVRKVFNDRAKGFAGGFAGAPELRSSDAERIRQYLEHRFLPSAQGLAIFASQARNSVRRHRARSAVW